VDRLHERQNKRKCRQERQKILDWLAPIYYAPEQHGFITRQQEGTGQWLLDSTEFQSWLKADKQTLFCPRIPGAGKTLLTSIVIDYLQTKFQRDPSIGFSYLYCNFRLQHEQKLEDFITALLKQLVQRQSSVSDSVKNLYQQHNRSSLDEFLRALHSVIANFSTVYIITNALDECQIVDGCRATFLSTLFNLQSKTRARLVAISRAILDIEKEFKGCLSREILASDKKLSK
jgi:hypothetical protein